jgi:hypothetical protein
VLVRLMSCGIAKRVCGDDRPGPLRKILCEALAYSPGLNDKFLSILKLFNE